MFSQSVLGRPILFFVTLKGLVLVLDRATLFFVSLKGILVVLSACLN